MLNVKPGSYLSSKRFTDNSDLSTLQGKWVKKLEIKWYIFFKFKNIIDKSDQNVKIIYVLMSSKACNKNAVKNTTLS